MIRAKLAAIAMVIAAPLLATTLAHVSVPNESTRIYVNDQLTSQPGTRREFVSDSSALDPSKLYHYDFRAVLDIDGQVYEKTLRVSFYPDNDISVRFTLQRDGNGWLLNGEATVRQGGGQSVPSQPQPPLQTPPAPSTQPAPTETPVALPTAPASGVVPGYPNYGNGYYPYNNGYPYGYGYPYPYGGDYP